MNKNVYTFDNFRIELSNLNKILFPISKITKKDIIIYYEKVAPFFLLYSKNHPIVMRRFPNGITQEGFYQKQIPNYFPSWIDRKKITLKEGEKQTVVVINKKATLAYLANQAVLEIHPWLSTTNNVKKPDRIVFDLDPSVNNVKELHFAAKKLKKVIEDYNLTPFLMTSGSRGYHIVVPIIPEYSFKKVRMFAKYIASHLTEKHNDRLTIEFFKSERKGRVFIDYLRNAYGQTSVACYSLRAKEKAPIATPIDWNELSRTMPQKYTIKNIFKRLAQKQDPWKDFFNKAKKLEL